MKKIETIKQAIKFLREKVGINTEIVDYKYRVFDNDFNCSIVDDKALIDYAKEQKEAIED